MTIYTYKYTRSFCDALGIDFPEIPELSDQVSDQYVHDNQESVPGMKHDSETKQSISLSNKLYYQTEDGKRRRLLLSEKNRKTKSEEMKRRWKLDYDQMKSQTAAGGRRKGCKDLKKRKTRTERKIECNGTIYETAVEAARHYYESNPHGPHHIRRLCRLQRSGWRYYD
jgi:hypothetical protein